MVRTDDLPSFASQQSDWHPSGLFADTLSDDTPAMIMLRNKRQIMTLRIKLEINDFADRISIPLSILIFKKFLHCHPHF
jgi:hypothetical protein